MKKSTLVSMVMGLILTFSSSSLFAESELNFQSYFSTSHAVTSQFSMNWIEEVKKASNGQLVIHHFGPGAIVNVNEMIGGVKNGMLDIVFTTLSAEDFPYLQPVNATFMVKNAVQAGHLFWEAYNTIPEVKKNIDEFGVPLMAYAQASSGFYSTKEAIRKPEDLKGKRVIVASSINAEEMKALGATPVFVSLTDVYIALQKGMGDILYTGILTAEAFKVQEIAKYVTPLCPSRNLILMIINKDSVNDLKAEEYTALVEVCKKMADIPGTVMDNAADKAYQNFKASGAELITLTAEEEAKFDERFASYMDQYWIGRMKENKVAEPEKVMAQFKEISDNLK